MGLHDLLQGYLYILDTNLFTVRFPLPNRILNATISNRTGTSSPFVFVVGFKIHGIKMRATEVLLDFQISGHKILGLYTGMYLIVES
jgi:hypothetical protein